MENCYPLSLLEPPNCDGFNAAAISNEPPFMVPWPIEPLFSASSSVRCHGFTSPAIPDKATVASKSHSEAEKRRRDRINSQLTALRKLIPKSNKMDKAALLGSAIEQVKDLKRKATEIGKAFAIPSETDEVSVDYNVPEDKTFIRVSICCDDRPEVFSELIRVLKGLRLSIVEAEISSVGGRTKSNLILCNESDNREGVSSTLKQSLNIVVNKINALSSDESKSSCRIRSKRQRLFLSS
ncbi:Transcription factor bHLH51 -like protein [Gossypium arboreum]|uniref:Transcription factor bHLH51-like protein n=1 Tax=Gossypium arboreum TaxID=29729 RepID=A0A0B0P528_GOSAR|nr:Transcription factor bHLH51 -like protein [Gossypium arboreum]